MFTSFEHQILRSLKSIDFTGKGLYVGVSGGVDSMVLLRTLCSLKKALKCTDIYAVHVHHGLAPEDPLQLQYRNTAWHFVKDHCQSQHIEFISNLLSIEDKQMSFSYAPENPLSSEAELREFRIGFFNSVVGKEDLLLLAQHQDDLFETRLVNLIRGGAALGLNSMSLKKSNVIRPLLQCNKKQLISYAAEEKIGFIKDPSNESVEPLRNWIRESWLPQLEKKRSGAVSAMARSLDTVADQLSLKNQAFECIQQDEIDLKKFLLLTENQKKQVLAIYMNQLQLPNYSRNHIIEVLKRIDSSASVHNFSLLKCAWEINTRRIKAIPDHGSKVRT